MSSRGTTAASCFHPPRLPTEGGSRGHAPLLAARVQGSPPSPGTSRGHLHATLSPHRAWGVLGNQASCRHTLIHAPVPTCTHTSTQTQVLHPHVHTRVQKHTHTNHNKGQPNLADKLPPAQASDRSWSGRRTPQERPDVRDLRPVSTVTSDTPRAHHVSVWAQASLCGDVSTAPSAILLLREAPRPPTLSKCSPQGDSPGQALQRANSQAHLRQRQAHLGLAQGTTHLGPVAARAQADHLHWAHSEQTKRTQNAQSTPETRAYVLPAEFTGDGPAQGGAHCTVSEPGNTTQATFPGLSRTPASHRNGGSPVQACEEDPHRGPSGLGGHRPGGR